MSPSPIAPSSASVIACRPASASEWPTSAVVVGDLDAAEPDAVAGAEAVGVEALADAHRARRAGDQLGHGEVLRIGELGERRIAGNQRHLAAGPLDHDGLVGRLLAGRPGGVGGLQRAEAEALRRLRPPEAGAGRSIDDPSDDRHRA